MGKEKFRSHKNPISIYGTNIDRIVVSNKVPFGRKGFKYFIVCENIYEKVMHLSISLPQISSHRRDFDEAKYMPFLINDIELLEIYNKI